MSVKELYNKYCQDNTDIPIFFQSWWLDAVCTNGEWTALISKDKQGEILAVWPLYIEKKWGQTLIKMPPMTPYLGPHIKSPDHLTKLNSKYSYTRKVLNDLIEQLPDFIYFNVLCHPGFEELLPLKWRGFKQTNEVSYMIDDMSNLDEVYNSFASSARNKISKAKDRFESEETKDINALYQLMNLTFEKQKKKNPFSLELIQRICDAIKVNQSTYLINQISSNSTVVAANFLVLDNNCAYNLLAGANPDYLKEGVMSLNIWKSIQLASKRVIQFDFEGGQIEPIESFFRSFGGRQVYYSRFVKTKNFLTDLYLLISGKI